MMFTFFKKIRRQLILAESTHRYLLYAFGEILLVVIGILIALQVNNWNEQRKQDERFKFGLRELYTDIQALSFSGSTINDKIGFQLSRIDSILYHGDEIPVHRLPGMIQLLDQYSADRNDNSWKAQYLEFTPDEPERNQLAKALRSIAFGWSSEMEYNLNEYELKNIMAHNLSEWNIPIRMYGAGTGYEEYIADSRMSYTKDQLERVQKLIKDDDFIADLMSIKNIKTEMIVFNQSIKNSSDSFLEYLKQYDQDTDYSIQYMEIIGTGLIDGQWATGVPMHKKNKDNDSVWFIEQELTDGKVKFRSDSDWVLDWGKGEEYADRLVFKGGDIQVKKGFYHIEIDIRNNTYSFTPVTR